MGDGRGGGIDKNICQYFKERKKKMLALSKYINIPVFVASLIIGLCIVHFSSNNEMRTIVVYPTPENVNLFQYKDKTDSCFEFRETEISCPSDRSKITIPTPSV